MTSLKSATSRAKRERLSCVLFLSSGIYKVNRSCFPSIFKVQTTFTPITIPYTRNEPLKVVKKLKFSTLVAKSFYRLNVH